MAMDAELARLIATLGGDATQYIKMLIDAQKATTQAGKGIETSLKGIEKTAKDSTAVFGKTIDELGTKMGNFAGQMRAMAAIESPFGFITSGVKLAADAEQLTISFGTMLQSEEKGLQMVKNLTKFAAETPLNMAGLQSTTKTLLQFGVTGNEIIPTIRMLGDVANGEQDKLSRLALSFGQARSAGRLMGQDLLQMISAGFNPLQEISRTTGKSMVQLKDDMEKGKISAEMLADAFKSATSEGGMFNEGMLKASKGAAGLWSTMQDDIDAAKRTVGAMVISQLMLKEAMQEVSKIAQRMTEWLNSLSSQYKNIITVVAVLVGGLGTLMIAWKVGAIMSGMVVGVLKDIVITFKWVIMGVYRYIASLSAATIAQRVLTAAMIGKALLLVAPAFFAIGLAIREMSDQMTGARGAAEDLSRELERLAHLNQKVTSEMGTKGEEELRVAVSVTDPTEKVEALKKVLLSAELTASEVRKDVAAVADDIDAMDTVGGSMRRASWVPFIGSDELSRWELAKKDLTDVSNRLELAEEHTKKVQAELTKAEAALGKPDAAATKAVDDFIKKLEDEIVTMRMSSEEKELYKLKTMKLTTAQVAAATSISEMAKAAKEEEKMRSGVADLTKSLREEIETMGMSTDQKRIYNLVTAGATNALLKEARVYNFINEGLNKHNKLFERGSTILKQYMTPQQKMQEQLEELDELLKEGIFTQEQYDFALTKVKEEFSNVGKEAENAKNQVIAFDQALAGGAEAQRRITAYVASLGTVEGRGGPSTNAANGPAPLMRPNQNGPANQQAVVDNLKRLAELLTDIRDKPGLVVGPARIGGGP